MTLPNIFTEPVATQVINRINQLQPSTNPQWGKMTVDQMLAHCCVAYEMVYEDIHPKPGFFMKIILKYFIKPSLTGPKPYKRNSPTAPAFIIKDRRDFELEKKRLVGYINKSQQLGEEHFDGKVSDSFGVMTKEQWNNMFYKHLDHHLTQFGV